MSSIRRIFCSILATLLLSGISLHADAGYSDQADAPFLLFTKVLFDDIDNGEFFSIFNPGHEKLDISNWSISDGEGELLLAPGSSILPHSELTVARSYSSARLLCSRRLWQFGKSPRIGFAKTFE